jgi:hypothetical protein
MGNEKVDKKMDGEKNYQKKVKGTEKTLVRNGWARRSRQGWARNGRTICWLN